MEEEDYFLDTSVFMCSIDETEQYHKNATMILANYGFLTSSIVIRELENILRLRNKIYWILISDQINKFKNLKEIRQFVFWQIPSSKNIKSHVERVFSQLSASIDLKENDEINATENNKLKEEAHRILAAPRTKLNIIVQNFNQPAYRAKHLIFVEISESSYQNLEKSLKTEIKPLPEQMNDLKIIANAVYHAYANILKHIIVSKDWFFIKNEPIIMAIICSKYHSHERNMFSAVRRITIKPLSEVT